MNSITHFSLALPFGKISAMRNTTRASTRVLCLHGWLDNCASFMPMMPYLRDIEVVAVDLAGHGRSDHRNRDSLYHYIDNVRDIKLILDALGWDRCHLLGHSMGGSLSLMCCAAFPERVQSLIMIDTLHPHSRMPKDGPAMLRRSIQQFSSWDPDRERTFPDLDSAIKARQMSSPYPQTEASARRIMEYALEKSGSQYRLRSDSRLNYRSPLMLSREQVNAFIKNIEQPVLAILASEGIMRHRSDLDQTCALFQNIQRVRLEGGHHIHMEKPQEIAQWVCCFLGVEPAATNGWAGK